MNQEGDIQFSGVIGVFLVCLFIVGVIYILSNKLGLSFPSLEALENALSLPSIDSYTSFFSKGDDSKNNLQKKRGEIVCLFHRNSGVENPTECVQGLKDHYGRYYNLLNLGQNVGGGGIGTKVVVEGFVDDDISGNYNVVGNMTVKSITVLE